MLMYVKAILRCYHPPDKPILGIGETWRRVQMGHLSWDFVWKQNHFKVIYSYFLTHNKESKIQISYFNANRSIGWHGIKRRSAFMWKSWGKFAINPKQANTEPGWEMGQLGFVVRVPPGIRRRISNSIRSVWRKKRQHGCQQS